MKTDPRQVRGWRARLRDFVVYVAISVAFVVLLAVGEIKHPSWFDWKWIAFALNTAVFCGYVVHWFQNVWRLPKFWLALFSLLALHSLGFVSVLHSIEHFPLIWYAVLVPLELQAAIVVYRRLGIHPAP